MRDAREPLALVEPERRPRRSAVLRNAAPAAPSGPVTTSRSPGRAPPRPGTRSERPSAVTLSDELRRGSCRRRRPARRSPRSPRRARRRPSTRVEAGAASETRSARGLRPRRREVAEVDRRRAPPEVAPAHPVEPEVDALDERVLRDDESVDLRRVVLDPLRRARAARAPRAARAHRAAKAPSTPLGAPRVGRSADDGDARRARADARAGVRRVDAADRDHRDRDRVRDPREPSSPIGGSASGFDGVAQTGPAPR